MSKDNPNNNNDNNSESEKDDFQDPWERAERLFQSGDAVSDAENDHSDFDFMLAMEGEDGSCSSSDDCPPDPCDDECGCDTDESDSTNAKSAPFNANTGVSRVKRSALSSVGPNLSLTYDNRFANSRDAGENWTVDSFGEAQMRGDTLNVDFGRKHGLRFRKKSDGTFEALRGAQATAGYADNDDLVITKSNGSLYRFDSTTEQIKESVDSLGRTSVYNYDSNLKVSSIRTSFSSNNQPVVETQTFEYCDDTTGLCYGRMETATLKRATGNANPQPGDFQDVQRAQLVYDTANGCMTYLKQQRPAAGTGATVWQDRRVEHFRYYEAGESDGFETGIKFIFEPNQYEALKASSIDLNNTNDTELTPFSSTYFKYDSQRRINYAGQRGDQYVNEVTYTENPNPGSDLYGDWTTKAEMTFNNQSVKIVYGNAAQKDILVEDIAADGQRWIHYFQYNSDGKRTKHVHPSAINYDGPAYDQDASDLNVQIKANDGLVELTTYYAQTDVNTGAAKGRVEYQKLQKGADPNTIINLSKTEYEQRCVGQGVECQTKYVPSKRISYRSDSGDPVETTYTYTWHNDSLQAQTVTTALPIVPTIQNGTGQVATTVAEYDILGRMIKQTDADQVETTYEYDTVTGARTKMTQDVGGLNIVTDYVVDDRGRTIESLGPVHNVDGNDIRTAAWTVYTDEHETRTAQGYVNVSNGVRTLVNPIQISRRSLDGTTTDQVTAVIGSGTEPSGLNVDSDGRFTLAEADNLDQSAWTAWTRQISDSFGQPQAQQVYHNIPAGTNSPGLLGTHYIETTFEYDSMQRQVKVTSPDGTITRRTVDARGLVLATWVGTDDSLQSSNNMKVVSETVYDQKGVAQPAHGGAGLATKQTQKVNGSPANNRVAEMEYDWRNRLVKTISTDGEHVFYQKPTLDNLGRTTKSQTFRVESVQDVLIAQSESFYDPRGQMYLSKTYGVNDNGVLGNALESKQWFDVKGQVIKSTSPGSQGFSKTVYDSLGRATIQYSAYFTGNGTDDPTSIANNVVLTESHMNYNDAGQAVETVSKDRLHDATGNGSLNGPSGGQPKSRDSYAFMYYDGMSRNVANANYGTNGGTVPTRPNSVPASSDTILVGQTMYDTDGRANKTIDPMGRTQFSQFDNAGRTIKTIANEGGSETQTVRTEYNPSGQLWKRIAENVDTGDQVTEYQYGTTPADSDIANNGLQTKLIHPDSGEVVYTYDRAGQQTSMTDPNGSTHQYIYDKSGRRIANIVTLDSSSNVDDSVLRIEHSYDNRGRLQNVTSYNAVTGTDIQSDIQYQYNSFGQIVKEYQQHDAEVDTNVSPVVQYGYLNGTENSIRQTSVTYPNGRELTYDYGAVGGESDLLSRISAIKSQVTPSSNVETLVTYDHRGSGQVETQTYNQPGIDKSYTLDRFGRMEGLNWSNDLVEFQYGYDRNSNRLFERDHKRNSQSNLLGYDALNRMESFETGSLNATNTTIGSPRLGQSFTLDETGNVKGLDQSGSAADPLNQTRVHDTVNEITSITQSAGATWATPDHDTNGNMTVIPQPNDLTEGYDATWDAWNRLVQLEDGNDTVAVYQYDGNNRRIVKDVYIDGTLEENRHVYYSNASQALEERIGSSSSAGTQFVWNLGYVDNLVLRDKGTERLYALNDLRFSIVALANTNGLIVERYAYDAHGRATTLASNYGSRSTSSYDWEFRYTGRREDLETGLYYFRSRYYSAELGRFISRDPLGFVDGMSLYRAYFVPNGGDPRGTNCSAGLQVTLKGPFPTVYDFTVKLACPEDGCWEMSTKFNNFSLQSIKFHGNCGDTAALGNLVAGLLGGVKAADVFAKDVCKDGKECEGIEINTTTHRKVLPFFYTIGEGCSVSGGISFDVQSTLAIGTCCSPDVAPGGPDQPPPPGSGGNNGGGSNNPLPPGRPPTSPGLPPGRPPTTPPN